MLLSLLGLSSNDIPNDSNDFYQVYYGTFFDNLSFFVFFSTNISVHDGHDEP